MVVWSIQLEAYYRIWPNLCSNRKPKNYCEPTVIVLVGHRSSSHKLPDSTSYWEYQPNTRRSFHCLSIRICLLSNFCTKPQMVRKTNRFSPAPLSFPTISVPYAGVRFHRLPLRIRHTYVSIVPKYSDRQSIYKRPETKISGDMDSL